VSSWAQIPCRCSPAKLGRIARLVVNWRRLVCIGYNGLPENHFTVAASHHESEQGAGTQASPSETSPETTTKADWEKSWSHGYMSAQNMTSLLTFSTVGGFAC
jgi:hypothetical protein